MTASSHYLNGFRLTASRSIEGKQLFPLVEYTLWLLPGPSELVAFGVVYPRGIVVVKKNEDKTSAGVLTASGILAPNCLDWDKIVEETLAARHGVRG